MGIVHLASVDAVLRGLLEQHGAPQLTPDRRLFHSLVRSIVSQQLSGAVARLILQRVEALCAPSGLEATVLASLPDEELRVAGLSRAKAAAVRDLAEHVLDGQLDLAHLEQLDDDAIKQQLVAVRGIGPWTAEMFLIFSLGRLDVWPVDDYGVRTAVKRAYALAELPKGPPLVALAQPWRPYRSVASLLLWHSLNNR